MKLSDDLKDARWIHIKGWLFLAIAVLAGITVLIPSFSILNVTLICLGMWAACRWYYYMFYVIEHYVDPNFRFAGLGSVLRYLASKRKN